MEVTGGVAKVTDDILRVPADFTALQLQQLPAVKTEGGRRRRKVRPVGGEGADAARAARVLPQCPPPPFRPVGTRRKKKDLRAQGLSPCAVHKG